jgi:hypothetical protein
VCSHTTTCPTASDFASRLGGVRVLPRVPWHPLPPPSSRWLGCRHASRGASSRLPARDSSSAATHPVVLAPASQLGAAQVPPRVPWRQLPPLGSRQLGCRHVSRGASSRLPAQGNSGAATCPTALCKPRAIKVYEYSPVELLSLYPIRACAYLPRRHTTRLTSRACETCSVRCIKY